jgi:hypothetical protein
VSPASPRAYYKSVSCISPLSQYVYELTYNNPEVPVLLNYLLTLPVQRITSALFLESNIAEEKGMLKQGDSSR